MISHKIEKFNLTSGKLILGLLTVQAASSFFSVAVNSIAFGIWCGIWIIQIIINRKILHYRERITGFNWINYSIALYVVAEFVSRVFAVIPEGAFIGLKRLLLILIFYVTILQLTKLKQLKIIYFFMLSVAGLVSIYELIVYAINLPTELTTLPFVEIRINYLGYPISLGQMKMFLLISLLPLMLVNNVIFNTRRYFLFFAIPIFISMILTQSRNVFLAFSICYFTATLILNRKIFLISLGVVIVSALLIPSEYLARFKSIADTEHLSNKSRIVMWETGLKMFADYPFTGVGDNDIKTVYEKYKKIEYDAEGSHLHSNYVMILATTGVFGFIGFMAFFILIFVKLLSIYKSPTDLMTGLTSLAGILLLISFLISGFFEWNFGDHKAMSVFFFLLALPFATSNIFNTKLN